MHQVTRELLRHLSSVSNVPTDDGWFALSAGEHEEDQPREGTRLLGAIQIACAAGRALNMGEISSDDAVASFRAVVNLFEGLSTETVRLWLSGRDESDFAIHRDFYTFEQRLGDSHPETSIVIDDFRRCIREKCGDTSFDIIADAVARRRPTFLSVSLGNLLSH